MNRSVVAIAAGLLSGLSRKEDRSVVIPSVKIEQKEEVEQLSKRKLQKAKGKRVRKNRGQNRQPKPQDTILYAMLRR